MDRWSFWSWCDLNRANFDEDVRENDFITFSLQMTFDHWLLDIIFAPLIAVVRPMFPVNLKFLWIFYFNKIGGTGRTDERTDGQTAALESSSSSSVVYSGS